MSRPDDPHIDMSRTESGHATRWLSSRFVRLMTSDRRKALRDGLHERLRRLRGAPHRVLYFHEVADPYSHLAVQTLASLAQHDHI